MADQKSFYWVIRIIFGATGNWDENLLHRQCKVESKVWGQHCVFQMFLQVLPWKSPFIMELSAFQTHTPRMISVVFLFVQTECFPQNVNWHFVGSIWSSGNVWSWWAERFPATVTETEQSHVGIVCPPPPSFPSQNSASSPSGGTSTEKQGD